MGYVVCWTDSGLTEKDMNMLNLNLNSRYFRARIGEHKWILDTELLKFMENE